ncbi:MAG: OadG family transporter subunit [Bacteroides sp.]
MLAIEKDHLSAKVSLSDNGDVDGQVVGCQQDSSAIEYSDAATVRYSEKSATRQVVNRLQNNGSTIEKDTLSAKVSLSDNGDVDGQVVIRQQDGSTMLVSTRTTQLKETPEEGTTLTHNAAPSSQSVMISTTTESIAKNNFTEEDTTGVGMTLIAMTVVLSALLLIFLIFKLIGRLMDRYLIRSEARAVAKTHGNTTFGKKAVDQAGVIAAISLALHESGNLRHDEEIVELTIQEFSRRYSPWNSKSFAVLHNRFRR